MYDFLSTNIEYLKGVGPARAQILRQEAHIHTFEDLLYYFPFRYINKNNIVKIAQIQDDQTYITVRGRIVGLSEKGGGRQRRLVASLHDDTGHIDLIWFSGLKWIKDKIKVGQWVSAFGKPNLYQHQFSLAHPDIEILPPDADLNLPAAPSSALEPIYSTTETMKKKGVTVKSLTQMTRQLFASGAESIPEILPRTVLEKYRLMSREEALREMHFPTAPQTWQYARTRCKFEELFLLQINILQNKLSKKQQPGFVFADVGEQFLHFFNHNLPFELTSAQKRVIREIRQDTKTGLQMNRLLQGDVGSGKTMVALMVMLLAIDNGFQACLMAPTEILARQHHQSFLKNLKGLPVRTALLCGATPKAERKPLLMALAQGDIQILIGTHALLEDEVVFKNLGLAVIDEQHRFGVAQRAKLWAKNRKPPHVLVMTATPIPRTLGMTLYGDLDTSVIDELPPNRKPIQTVHFTDSARLRVFAFMKEEIRKGRQIYVVYPLIKESENLDLKDLMDGYESISRAFPPPEYAVSIVHGQMKPDVKAYEMQRFIKGETQIMVSTTVIEVGVDVPNASVMVIENSERFGLAQLHQLRGRVGRGAEQSYCLLMTADRLSADAKKRIQTMVDTQDGFKIAEADLQLRGPGDLQGTQQSGVLELRIADLVEDAPIVQAARNAAMEILTEDPTLTAEKNLPLALEVRHRKRENFWARIS